MKKTICKPLDVNFGRVCQINVHVNPFETAKTRVNKTKKHTDVYLKNGDFLSRNVKAYEMRPVRTKKHALRDFRACLCLHESKFSRAVRPE
ncbi:MAG: hypothetical protein IKJ11_07945 [Clostridia bacterium]|nr:hypothetical protein [Clostridia bacterium]